MRRTCALLLTSARDPQCASSILPFQSPVSDMQGMREVGDCIFTCEYKNRVQRIVDCRRSRRRSWPVAVHRHRVRIRNPNRRSIRRAKPSDESPLLPLLLVKNVETRAIDTVDRLVCTMKLKHVDETAVFRHVGNHLTQSRLDILPHTTLESA